jgi:hypothetical protein
MKKIIVPIVTMSFVLTGCGPSNKLEDVYGDKDAEDTYDAMIEYMEENVTYYREELTTTMHYSSEPIKEIGDTEYLINEDGAYQMIVREYKENDEIDDFYIRDSEKQYTLSYDMLDDAYKYYVSELDKSDKNFTYGHFGLDSDNTEILDAKRRDKDDSIVLIFQVVSDKDAKYPFYWEIEYVIGSDGYLLSSEQIAYLQDDTFEYKGYTNLYEIKDINEEDSIDTKSAIEEIEDYADKLVD